MHHRGSTFFPEQTPTELLWLRCLVQENTKREEKKRRNTKEKINNNNNKKSITAKK